MPELRGRPSAAKDKRERQILGLYQLPRLQSDLPGQAGQARSGRQKENNSEQRTSMPSMRQGVDTPPLGQRQEEILVELFRFPGL
jgi:hypothetical protein